MKGPRIVEKGFFLLTDTHLRTSVVEIL